MINYSPLRDLKRNGHYLVNNNIFIPIKVINLYISYTLDSWSRDLNTYFTLINCLLGSIRLTKNLDPDKYKFSGYIVGFDSRSKFLLTDGSVEKNIIIFWADISSSVHIDNKSKGILIFGEGPRFRWYYVNSRN